MNSSLDTNIVLRYLWDDNHAQSAKVKRLFADGSQTLYVSDLVFAEVIFNLQTRKIPRADIVAVMNGLIEMPNVEVSKLVSEKVLPFYAEHPALSFVDCYAAFEAEKRGREPLFTFDRKLANQHPSAKML